MFYKYLSLLSIPGLIYPPLFFMSYLSARFRFQTLTQTFHRVKDTVKRCDMEGNKAICKQDLY